MSAITNYQPLLSLLLGGIGWLAALGVGVLLLDMARIRLTPPWKQATGFLLGMLCLSLAVQLISIAGLASQNILLGLAAIFTRVGAVGIFRKPL